MNRIQAAPNMACQNEADLPSNLKCLKNVDNLLRCPICFDFLNITMMTKCSHNFCSLCIRKFLSYKLECPVCKSPTVEQDLRNNRLLDDVVMNFQMARQELSKVTFDSPPISPKTGATAVKSETPGERPPKKTGSILSHFFQKGPNALPSAETQGETSGPAITSALGGRRHNEPAYTHTRKDSDIHSLASLPSVAVKEEPSEEDIDIAARSLPSTAGCPSATPDIKPVIKVECPVCATGVSQHFINKHLDLCLNRGQKKDSLRSCQKDGRRPMGKLVYTLLSLSALKRKLRECHLSVQGNREQLVKRHQEFVHIYNAQCDSLDPRPAEDIAREVEANEKTRNQLQDKAKPVLVFSKKQTAEEIDEIHSTYRKQHSSEYSRLIAQVRGRLETTRKTRVKQEASEEGEAARRADGPAEMKDAAESEGCLPVMSGETGADQQVSRAHSPAVSISSSISDVYGPESDKDLEPTQKTPAKTRARRSNEDEFTSPPVLRKRCRRI